MAKRIEDYLRYEPETGDFYWIRSAGNRIKAGAKAGGCSRVGVQVGFDGKKYRGARLAWKLQTGDWPDYQIDHINGNDTDNRWANLRHATQKQNMQNLRHQNRNKLGLLGVSKDHGLYRARIAVDGKEFEIGRFSTPQAAHEAYKAAKRKLHQFNPEIRT